MELNTSAAVATATISAVFGFGSAFYLQRQVHDLIRTKAQKVLLFVITTFLGYGISGILNEIVGYFLIGLPIRSDKVWGYLIVHLAFVPSILGVLIWLLKPKSIEYLQSSSFEQVDYNQNSNQSSTSSRNQTNAPAKRSGAESSAIGISILSPKEEDVWKLVANEYQSPSRRVGLHAKLFTEHNGDETQIKIAYLKQRVQEISMSDTHSESKKQVSVIESSLTNIQLIKRKKFSLGKVSGIECLLLMNGKGAVITRGRDYRIYADEKTMTMAAVNFKKTGEYPEEGFIEFIKREAIFD